jgi:hypothetical protein
MEAGMKDSPLEAKMSGSPCLPNNFPESLTFVHFLPCL